MSFSKKGFTDGVKKKGKNPPKKDGIFGTSILQSDKSRNRTNAYEGHYKKGVNARRSTMNCIQKLFD